jgi:hypothetical protein
MGELVTAQQQREKALTRMVNRAAPAPPPPGSSTSDVVPLLRQLQPGEQRVDALLERIECPRNGVILHVRIGDRAARFPADSLEAVEFLTFRADRTAPVQCGNRVPPERVYLTFRPATDAGFDGTAVAVEFLPR